MPLTPENWDALEQRHGVFVREAEAAVTDWIAAPKDADWEGPYALWSERNGKRACSTAPLSMPDVEWRRAVLYGKDRDGAVVVARRFTVIGERRRLDSEVLWATLAGRPTQLLFLHRHAPSGEASVVLLRVTVPIRRDGRLEGVQSWFDPRSPDGGESVETYHYDGDVLTRITHEHRGAKLRREDLSITYDADGTLARIDARVTPPPPDGDGEFIVYLNIDTAAVRAAHEAVEALLPAAIVAWATRVAPADEVPRSLLIGYIRPPNDILPPALALGVEGDEAATLAAHTGDIDDLFDPTQQHVTDPVPAELTDKALREPFATLNQHWHEEADDDGPRRLLAAVATHLAELDWAELLPRVDRDFVVAAVALERDGTLEDNLRASVPAAVRERLLSPGA